jgi:hypothetical protein
MKHIFILVTFCFTFYTNASSQLSSYYLDPYKHLSQFICENWTTEDNLPTNSLLHLCQSKDGYLWITSYNGLIRFDGNQFKVFNKKNTNVLENDAIREIAIDRKGKLWITTQ